VQPNETEPICLISYEITALLLAGGPDSRTSFWKAYRRELELNQKTNYQNYHIHLCRQHLADLKLDRSRPVFFRNGRLVTEKEIQIERPKALPTPSHSEGRH
jgi:hypothetical protein